MEQTICSYAEIAGMIDHALLQPTLTDLDLEQSCIWAASANLASVCIKPYAVRLATRVLQGSHVKVGTVIGFPQGGHRTSIKIAEAREAIDDGAMELDMVVNIGKVLSRDWNYVADEIGAVRVIALQGDAILKVIFETSMIKDEHKIRLCEICGDLDVDFVKTSTGYGDGGATNPDILLMRKYSPPAVQVKASGGIRTLDRVLELRAMGVTRIGTTSTRTILQEVVDRLPNQG